MLQEIISDTLHNQEQEIMLDGITMIKIRPSHDHTTFTIGVIVPIKIVLVFHQAIDGAGSLIIKTHTIISWTTTLFIWHTFPLCVIHLSLLNIGYLDVGYNW